MELFLVRRVELEVTGSSRRPLFLPVVGFVFVQDEDDGPLHQILLARHEGDAASVSITSP
mgnify:CR=1 FL=1